MAELPPLKYGKVVGRFVAIIGDTSADPDSYPEAVPLSGKVYLRPTPELLRVASALPVPATAIPALVPCELDADGYLSYGADQFVWIPATDDTATNPTDYTWEVSFDLDNNGRAVQLAGFPFHVPAWDPTANGGAGNPVDLTLVAPLVISDGVMITKGDPGVGVATGGTTGQVLAKTSDADYDTAWIDKLPTIPSTANLNDIIQPGVYSLVDPDVGGQVAHDTTLVDPLWNGTFWGQWAILTVTLGGANGWGTVFQTIEYLESMDDGIIYIARNPVSEPTGAWYKFSKLVPFTPAPRQLLSFGATTILPLESNIGDLWISSNDTGGRTFTFGLFGINQGLNGLSLDVSFVTGSVKFTFAAVAGITLVVPAGKKASCTKGVVRAVGVRTTGSVNGTVFLSGDLDAA